MKAKYVLLVVLIALVAISVYEYDQYTQLYGSNLSALSNVAPSTVKKSVWDEYKANMDKLAQIFPVDYVYMPWAEFYPFAKHVTKDPHVEVYFDDAAMKIWVEETFSMSHFKVTVYEHSNPDNFIKFLRTSLG